MVEHGLLPDFPPAVRTEVAALAGQEQGDGAPPRDLRDRLWVSIDNDDSRDLDQLSVAEPARGGAVKILVAVADVDAAVSRGSATDGHARHNTTSVYTAGGIFPMLPERLSTDLTSLAEGEERLAIVVEMMVDPAGTVGASDVYRARVLNHAKLAYNSVAAWLEGAAPPPPRVSVVAGVDEQLRTQDRVAQALRAVRDRHGALSLRTIESRAVFDGDELLDLRADEGNRAKELIEDFMIAANIAVVGYLTARGFPSLRRVLRSPERWERIVEVAARFDERLPPEPDAAALAQFLDRRRRADPATFPDLSLTVVKLMGRGEYALERAGTDGDGHFGLAVADYTHSTAPNRRFPDLVSQRLVKAALAGRPVPYADAELTSLAQHCTVQEDSAQKVERQVRKSAAALLLAPRIGQEFDAIVTGASSKGTWVRIERPPVEGKLVHGFDGLDVGDRVHVKLVETNVDRGFIDFVRAR
jgi:exoribonuclease-2